MFGGLLVYCGVMWWVIKGQIQVLLDIMFCLMGGGVEGILGEIFSWVFGIVVLLIVVGLMLLSCCCKVSYGFVVKFVWVEGILMILVVGLIICFVWVMNFYLIVKGVLCCIIEVCGIEMIDDFVMYYGVVILVVILLVVMIVMILIVICICFGCYIYVIGGNLEVVEFFGINICLFIVKIFVLMGVLMGVVLIIVLVCLNVVDVGLGMLDELCVIVVVVIGGMVLLGGFGMIYGVVIGVLIM